MTLDSKDISVLDDKCKQLNELGQDAVADKVQKSIDDGKINKSNFNSSCMKLDALIEKHKKEK